MSLRKVRDMQDSRIKGKVNAKKLSWRSNFCERHLMTGKYLQGRAYAKRPYNRESVSKIDWEKEIYAEKS